MQTPSDLKNYRAPDAFQLVEPYHAGYACLVIVLILIAFAPVMK